MWWLVLTAVVRRVARSVVLPIGTDPDKGEDGSWGCPGVGLGCDFKGTKHRCHVVRHIRMHTGHKPYVCLCGYRTAYVSGLYKHIDGFDSEGHDRVDDWSDDTR